MIVKQIWTANAYRNFNYLIACAETGDALAVDPLDSDKCIAAARDAGWEITQILNTHEHRDHTGGNDAVVAKTGAAILAHHNAAGKIANVSRGLQAGDLIKVGKTVELEAMDTPGHTMCHICLRSHGERPALFCGDTLFACGCGRLFEGTPAQMVASLAKLAALSPATQVYCGHEYTLANLRFADAVEPGNPAIGARVAREQAKRDRGLPTLPTTIAEERATNPFLRVGEPGVRAVAEARAGRKLAGDVAVFAALREWKNAF